MSEIYFTIAGTNYHYGQDFIEPKMQVKLVKEPDNEVDSEAIKVMMPGIGHIGYVANILEMPKWHLIFLLERGFA